MTTFKQQMALDTDIFVNTDEFAELMVYTSPAGVVTNNVKIVTAEQTFVQEYDNYAGLGATLSLAKSTLANPEIHGTLTATDGKVYVIQDIFALDDNFVTISAVADKRISPNGMR